jgi:hypothetical protein
MKEVLVGKYPSLYFQTTASTGIIWRQWVIVESGFAFAIVSAIKPESESEILPDVQKMVDSFQVVIPIEKQDRKVNGASTSQDDSSQTSASDSSKSKPTTVPPRTDTSTTSSKNDANVIKAQPRQH